VWRADMNEGVTGAVGRVALERWADGDGGWSAGPRGGVGEGGFWFGGGGGGGG